MRALCRSSKAACQGNTAVEASSNKTLGGYSQRLSWSTSGKALPRRRERLLKVPRCYFSVQHDVQADIGNIS